MKIYQDHVPGSACYYVDEPNFNLTRILEPSSNLTPAMSEMLNEFSLFINHILPNVKVFGGWLLYLPKLLPRLDPTCSPLLAAIHAVFFGIQSFTHRRDFMSPESMFHHTKALSLLRRSLSAADTIPSHELLMAAMVLNFYEACIHPYSSARHLL
jgi:hypothetical protein